MGNCLLYDIPIEYGTELLMQILQKLIDVSFKSVLKNCKTFETSLNVVQAFQSKKFLHGA